MGNAHVKPHPRSRNKKQVHWKAADRPSPPGKPSLATDSDFIPDVVTIRWTKPVSDGGSPITGYLVEHRRTGSPHWLRSTPVLLQLPELTISGLEPGWRYQFRVRAQNTVGHSEPSELSEPITFNAERTAVIPPRFTQELVDTTALENEKAEFVVHYLGQPAPKICWFKDGFEIFSSRRTRIITENSRSTLTIHQSALSDEGEIKCTATNRAGHASTKSKLTLEAPPSIRLPRQYEDGLLFEIGEMMRLKVSVAGRPTPLLFWYHNGEALQNSDRYEMSYGEKSSILKIDEAKRSDRGEYQVKAVNKLGEDAASFLVTVTDKPSPPGIARVIMTLGRSVTLSWQTPKDDGGCKIGNYIIEYYRVGWNVWLKAATSRQLSTVLGDLIEGSEYKFRVKAESPYGVSDPSEETEVVFIPDPKRGILTPERSRSQPRDIIEEVMTPVPSRRKNKPRSLSSSRSEIESKMPAAHLFNNEVPVRPQRTKSKSRPTTPQASPHVARKEKKPTINSELFDRISMERELSYGSPEYKAKKTDLGPPQTDYLLGYSSSSDKSDPRSRSPSPFVDKMKPPERRVSIYSIENLQDPSPHPAPKAPTPPRFADDQVQDIRRRLSRQHSENLTGSSEFMLVLYPDGNEKGHGDAEDYSFNIDDDIIPPPLSLSAPELGTEPPRIPQLRHAASSTELLHERSMIRFYQAAEEAEAEALKARENQKRKQSIIPKITISSQDNENIVSLEKQEAVRRRKSIGTTGQQRAIWAQRRHSLRGPNDIMQVVEEKLHIIPKKDRQRSISETIEEAEPKVIMKVEQHEAVSPEKNHKTKTSTEHKWCAGEYEESVSEESESVSESEDERPRDIMPKTPSFEEEDEETYHPGIIRNMGNITRTEEPFEILTKRKDLPDPNFIPKPILKKGENEAIHRETGGRSQKKDDVLFRMRTQSPMPKFRDSSNFMKSETSDEPSIRERSVSLTTDDIVSFPPENIRSNNKKVNPNNSLGPTKARQRSASLNVDIPIEYNLNGSIKSSSNSSPSSSRKNISAIASISGITAASVIIPGELLKRKADEEARVVIDHYGDIIKSYKEQKQNQLTSEIPLHTNSRRDSTSDSKRDSGEYEPPLEEFMAARPVPVETSMNISEPALEKRVKDISIKQETPQKGIQPVAKPINRTTKNPSPEMTIRQTEKRRTSSRSSSRSSSTSRKITRDLTKSPMRLESWSDIRPTSPAKKSLPPLRQNYRAHSRSPSPVPLQKRRPKMKEIMTQTSVGLDNYTPDSGFLSSKELMAQTKVKVRTTVDYITDLAMFTVACWLYIFDNELLALPVLFIMVYRQTTEEIKKRIPKWICKRFKRFKGKSK